MSMLYDEPPVFFQPTLVRRVGIIEAALIQQLHFWSQRATRMHEGHAYVYKTYQDWSDEIGVTAKSVRGALDRLRRDELVVAIQNPTDPRDRTLWWRVAYDVLEPGARSDPEGSSPPPRAVRPTAPRGTSNAGASESGSSTPTSSTAIERAHAVRFNGKPAPAKVAEQAQAAVASWGERTSQTIKCFTGTGKQSDSLTRVVGAMLDYPEVVELWPTMMDRALSAPWWTDDAPGVGVVFGPKVVERMIEQAKRPVSVAEGNVRLIRGGKAERVDWGQVARDLEAKGL